jgi:glycosyltransferase involved in cell wall biosynthesis
MPKVSVIIPCLNEAKFIGPCLDSVLSGDFPSADMEVLVVDGNSEDGTGRIVDQYAQRHRNVRQVPNPMRNTPCALNIGLAHSRGDVIIRLDAHALYPPGYITQLVDWLEKSGADNVGGVWETVPAGSGSTCRAIAIALSHPFGVGNSYFRIGSKEPRWVETVPFGCYRRQVFDRIGVFDEELLRNQDDEFNYRLLKHSGRILLIPDIVTRYYARDSFRRLWRMYFQYGLFKPLVIFKIGGVVRLRHAIPALLVCSVGLGALLAVFVRPLLIVPVALLLLYAFAALLGAIAGTRRAAEGLALVPKLWIAFATIHWAYGLGFACGIGKLAGRRWRGFNTSGQWIPTSR